MPGCTVAIGRSSWAVPGVGTLSAIVPVRAAGQGADPSAVAPRIRLMTHDRDRVVVGIRAIRA